MSLEWKERRTKTRKEEKWPWPEATRGIKKFQKILSTGGTSELPRLAWKKLNNAFEKQREKWKEKLVDRRLLGTTTRRIHLSRS